MPRNKTSKLAIAALGLCLGLSVTGIDGAGNAAFSKESIKVTVDRAKVMRIKSPADTVIVGNPAVADAVMHDPNTLVIVGRSFGTTNLIILDNDSKPIADEVIVVRPAESTVVTVQRRNARFSYSCAPNCSPAPTPGDQNEYFNQNSEQTSKRNQSAQAAAKGSN